MKKLFASSTILFLSISIMNAQYSLKNKAAKKFVLQFAFPEGIPAKETSISMQPFNYAMFTSIEREKYSEEPDNMLSWKFTSIEPKWVNILPVVSKNNDWFFILPMEEPNIVWYLAEPGDSIHVTYKNKSFEFTGKGAKGWELIYRIEQLNYSIDRSERRGLSNRNETPVNLQDYFNWNQFLNNKVAVILPEIKKYKPLVSKKVYENVMNNFFRFIEERRLWHFRNLSLRSDDRKSNRYGLTNKDMCNIYDSTMKNRWSDWLINKTELTPSAFYLWQMLRLELYRKQEKFFRTPGDTAEILGKREEDQYLLVYGLAKKKFRGDKREQLLSYPFTFSKGIFDKAGITDVVDSLLSAYYAEPGFPEYKEKVRAAEEKLRRTYAMKFAPSFELTDASGNSFSNKQLLGKFFILDFWYTGCMGCVQMGPALGKVAEHFKNDTNVVFVNISIDKNRDKWLNSIKKGTYTTDKGIHLYTNSKGRDHEIINKLVVSSYPTLVMVDPAGKLVVFNSRQVDPRLDEGKKLIQLINNRHAVSQDGPYVFYNGKDSVVTHDFKEGKVITNYYPSSKNVSTLKARTDENIPFHITLKDKLTNETSVHEQPQKLFVLSDIEGNFEAFRKLLVNNKIIDEQLNWTFGNGHLVFAGDMFDRGNQVTECLWMVYSLEEKAKASGGYVHFVLGNHEVMNLYGDNNYVVEKYKENAKKLNKSLVALYDKDSELGRWLRTKNMVEKIGGLLFAHGGISQFINEMRLSVEQINAIGRLHYDSIPKDIQDKKTKRLMFVSGPLWYRGYYRSDRADYPASSAQIDSTLQKFDVKRIITGHTVISDTISVHWDQRVVNTDTRHAEGKSEALFIEGNTYYRVNQEGKKTLLFIDDKKKQPNP